MTSTLARALASTAPARARLERIYGRVPAVIAFLQRDDGPITIHRCLRLVGTVEKLYRTGDGEIAVRAVVPGGRALENWWQRRLVNAGWILADEHRMISDAKSFATMHRETFEDTGDVRAAARAALREHDVFLADFERLYLNGTTYPEMASMSGLTENQVKATLERMRRLGFDLPFRLGYTRRTSV